ncbi:MAG: ABC transporter ATP-binding protein, partial [Propionibacteriaceae bacterium]|nr:ABC transporter ATP-binding protein [Propionibacteriaceae bacterium]
MLHLDDIRKTYHAGNFTQAALDGVTLTLRDNEFVAVLGPSGSGKTTLLNIVGGLDHYDSGDLIIDQVSTSDYTDRDWDTYRNNRIGFVFQSYNLIPHQTVLANVELALTLSGVGKAERSERARQALNQVGLVEHIHKLPGQLSGGQMQRVAIARALINDPEILLADEPTGALDSKTSVQVMNLLQGIAEDRLVVMVTHNPDLAEQYATRIVSLKDGRVVDDTRPYAPTVADQRPAKSARRTSMSFFTAIALSFRNLMTKKGRTLMTSFAGSIGIIGIAAILAIANGVNAYIHSVEEDTLSLYPLSIQTQGVNLTSLLTASAGSGASSGSAEAGEVGETQMIARMFSRIGSNDLTSLKAHLDSPDSGIEAWVNAIQYSYDVTPQIFAADTSDGARQVNPNTVFSSLGIGSTSSSSMLSSFGMSADVFDALPDDRDLLAGQYDTVAGHWPENDNECLLVLNSAGRISDLMAYVMGLRDPANLDQMVSQLTQGKPITVDSESPSFSYDQLLGVKFKVVPATAFYQWDQSYGVWADRSGDETWMESVVADGEPLTVSGIVKPNPSSTANMLGAGLYYTPDLVHHLMDQASEADVVKQQLANPSVNVFDGNTFSEDSKRNSLSDFDFSSLIKIDQNALSDLFTGDLSNVSPSLPDMDLSSALTQMPTIAAPDLTSLLSGLDLNVSPEAITKLMTDTLADYLSDMFGGALGTDPSTLPTITLPTLPSEFPTVLPTAAQPSSTAGPTGTPPAAAAPPTPAATSSTPAGSTPSPDPTSSTTSSSAQPSATSSPVLLPTPPQLGLAGALHRSSPSSAATAPTVETPTAAT